MSKQSVEKGTAINVANDDWSDVVGLTNGGKRFQLEKKPKIVDIESTNTTIEELAKVDDAIHQDNLIKDEKILREYEAEKVARENEAKKIADEKVNTDTIDVSNKKPIVLNVADKKLINNDNSLSASGDNKGVVSSESPSVKTQTQELTTPPNTVEGKETKKGFAKNITKGLAQLYVNKTSNILNPVKFIVDNYKKFGMAVIQLGIPALITWYLMQMPFVSQQIAATGSVMSTVYVGVFYFAVIFLWCFFLFMMYMVGRMIKREAIEVAKIGKEEKD